MSRKSPLLNRLSGRSAQPNALQFQKLLDSIDGIVWMADAADFRFTYVSRHAEDILGYPIDQWLTEPDFWLKHLHPDDREWVVPYCVDSTKDGRDHSFDYRMISANGSVVWLRDNVTVVTEPDGSTEICGVMVNVTERKALEEKTRMIQMRLKQQNSVLVDLAKSDELAEGDLDSCFRRLAREDALTLNVERVSIWFFNTDRTLLRCASLYELTEDKFSGGAELEAVRYPRYFAALGRGRSVAAGDARSHPDTSEFADDYLVPLGIGAMLDAPIRRASGLAGVVCHEHVGATRSWEPDEREFAASVADFVALVLESRERRSAEESAIEAKEELFELQRREKAQVEGELAKVREDLVRNTRMATIGQVAASIAHELRNPLGSIRNAMYYLKSRVPEDQPEWKDYLGVVDQETDRSDRIIRNLLDMSRAKKPRFEPVDLESLTKETFRATSGSKHITLAIVTEPTPFFLSADRVQLQQVLANLLDNAVQVMEGRGRIEIRGARGEGCDEIFVSDEGPGVAEEQLERIFEPLFTTKTRGTGLGLSISRQIVGQHGGTLECLPPAGDGKAGGAVFRIRLPAQA